MKVFVLEGHNDIIVMDTILRKYFSIEKFPRAHDREFRRSINILRQKLLNQKEYHWIKTNFGFIVYGDNGKQTLISKVLPRLVSDIIGKIAEPVELFVILDEDGIPLQRTTEDIYQKLQKRRILYAQISFLSQNEVIIKSSLDSRYQIIIRVHLIPESLEKQLVKCITSKINLPPKKRADLLNMGPHEALNDIAGMLGTSRDTLIRNVVIHYRFCEYEWFHTLLAEIQHFLTS
ncbi:hypothetical protein [Thermococcus sp.]